MTEAEQIKALQSENDRLRAELDLMNDTLTGNLRHLAELAAIKARVPSDEEIREFGKDSWRSSSSASAFILGAHWMRDRIFTNQNEK